MPHCFNRSGALSVELNNIFNTKHTIYEIIINTGRKENTSTETGRSLDCRSN